MKQLIEQRTMLEKKFKAKQQELDEIKQEIDEIKNTDLFNMTFEKHAKKSQLHDYYYEQAGKLAKHIESVRLNTNNGNLVEPITNYIREQADNCTNVQSHFESFESNPNNEGLKEAYYSAFNAKVDELHDKAIELLSEYFKAVGEETERLFKIQINNELPAPISAGNIEVNAESKAKGIPYDYARRNTTR